MNKGFKGVFAGRTWRLAGAGDLAANIAKKEAGFYELINTAGNLGIF